MRAAQLPAITSTIRGRPVNAAYPRGGGRSRPGVGVPNDSTARAARRHMAAQWAATASASSSVGDLAQDAPA
eukprot:5314344-Alexandrium_andersonii.AAC.1